MNSITKHSSIVANACRCIETAEQPPSLSELARRAGMSPFHFQRVFTRSTGLSPKAYAAARRAERLRSELRRRATVTEAAYAAGFNSSARFYETSTRTLGMTPRRFKNGGPGETIRFAIGECSLGSVLVAASEIGVCAVFLGDDPERLARELQDCFPKATLVGGDKSFERLASTIVGFVESPKAGFDLPLDVRGTVFQKKVWDALTRIKPGTTASYSEIARKIGCPNAVRAVASACASNRIAMAIPCHRVVHADGSLSGYRWGVDRKRALLLREKNGAWSELKEVAADVRRTRRLTIKRMSKASAVLADTLSHPIGEGRGEGRR